MSENIVKLTCKELGITQKELAERLGVTTSAISQWNNEVPKVAQVALKLLVENHELRQALNDIVKGQIAINKFLAVQNLDT